jgi:hypothetical protein
MLVSEEGICSMEIVNCFEENCDYFSYTHIQKIDIA